MSVEPYDIVHLGKTDQRIYTKYVIDGIQFPNVFRFFEWNESTFFFKLKPLNFKAYNQKQIPFEMVAKCFTILPQDVITGQTTRYDQ